MSSLARGCRRGQALVKRCFDLAVATLALTLLSPLLAALAVLVRATSPGPVLYRSERVGRGGSTFRMVKLRTMVADADRRGPLVTAGDDPRITPLGRVLRHTKLDELPTLWNVIRGDMSLVGPRPENPRSAALYSPEQRRILSVRPGITSPASVAYRHEERILAGAADLDSAYYQVMQAKLALDLDYVDRQSLWLDLRILGKTVAAIVR
jgi:lipopolysaccharide/colanic/teichoic acid biosynthesis glycosyltransferase